MTPTCIHWTDNGRPHSGRCGSPCAVKFSGAQPSHAVCEICVFHEGPVRPKPERFTPLTESVIGIMPAGCCEAKIVRDFLGIEYIGWPFWARWFVPSLRNTKGCGCFSRWSNWVRENNWRNYSEEDGPLAATWKALCA